ncbi:phosphodiesterase GepA [Vibrio proteolyticus]
MRLASKITLRTAVVVPFVMIVLFTIGVIVAAQKRNYEEMVQDVSLKQLGSLTNNVTLELRNFLEAPFQINQILSHGISYHQLYPSADLSAVENYLRSSFTRIYQPLQQIDVISFGSEGAEYVGIRKEPNQKYALMVKDARTAQVLTIYQSDRISDDVRSSIADYNPKLRPWYTPIVANPEPAWSPIYANVDEKQEVTLSALAPVMDGSQLLGVMVTDVKINTFNAFLRRLHRNTTALVYLTDNQQRLIASSSKSSIVSWGTEQTQAGERLLATESINPVIAAGSEYARQHQLTQNKSTQHFSFAQDGDRYFSLLTPYHDPHGLQWYIGVIIAETDLLGTLPQKQEKSWLLGIGVSVIGILLGLVAFNRIMAPITTTANTARRIAQGDWDSQLPKPGQIYETSMLVNAFNEMTNSLKASFDALRYQLLYDSLTKLYSRQGLIDTGNNLFHLNGSLLLIGVNKFREINDSLGHNHGDQLLLNIAERLRSFTSPDNLLARIGGDEFAIYLPDPMSAAQVHDMANHIQQRFAAPFRMQGEHIVVSVSVGVVAECRETDMATWLRNGSIALSNAKRELSGISDYSPEMADLSLKRTRMLTKIRSGIERQEFVPFYQPIVDLNSGEIVGAEALARWLSPTTGMIPPIEFIALAEDSGLIGQIGEQILYQACRDTMLGIEQGKWSADFKLHVNLSVNQLSQPNLLTSLSEILRNTGMNASNLTLEITESRIVDKDPVIADNMRSIKQLGINIGIDDFGTGYSSLAYLHQLPFDCLKIDRAFVEKMRPDTLHDSIVAAIITMTKSMQVDLIAEGVETEEQAQMLQQLHCPHAQGYLYSRPVPFDEWPTDLVNMH